MQASVSMFKSNTGAYDKMWKIFVFIKIITRYSLFVKVYTQSKI